VCFYCVFIMIFYAHRNLRPLSSVVPLKRPSKIYPPTVHHHPFLHSLHVLSLFFLFLFFFFSLIHLPNSFHKFSVSDANPYFLPFQSFPIHPSLSHQLDHSSFPLLTFFSNRRSHLLTSPQSSNCLILLLLLLCGDVHLNPGPNPTLNFAHLNTRSATSVTPTLDKPALLTDFLLDESIDILTITETWLSPSSPSNVLNSLTPVVRV